MLINLGGALGFVLGSTMTLMGQSTGDAQATTMILLSVGGLAVGAMVTQDWDATHNSAVLARSESPTVLTMEDGKIKLGRLLPQVRPEVKVTRVEDQTHRTTGMSVHLGLLGGQF